MSLQKKLKDAAVAAATEAVARERARCLWVLDELKGKLEFELSQRILVEQQRHLVEAKLQIFKSLLFQVRMAIAKGARPMLPLKDYETPIGDIGELQDQVLKMREVLFELGWGEDSTVEEIKEQIEEWDQQEDRIIELEAKLEEARNADG